MSNHMKVFLCVRRSGTGWIENLNFLLGRDRTVRKLRLPQFSSAFTTTNR